MQEFYTSSATGDLAINSVVISAICSFIIQAAKNSRAPFLAFIDHCTPWMSRFVAVVLAALTAAGFTASYDAHGGSLVIGGLTLQGAVLFVWLVIKNYTIQHVTYKVIQSASTAKAIGKAADAAKLPEPPTPLI